MKTTAMFSDFLGDDRGAVDLPSTMVTVVILAALFGAIALTVFKIAPWAQDGVAKSDVAAICSAQDLYQTMRSGEGVTHRYADMTALVNQGLLSSGILSSTTLSITLGGTATPGNLDDDTFQVDRKSTSGKTFRGTNVNCTPVEATAVIPVALPHEAFLDGAVFKAQPGVDLAVTRTQMGNTVTYVLRLTTASATNISTRTTVDWSAWFAKNLDPTPKDMTFKNWKVYGGGSIMAPTIASQTYTSLASDVSWQWAYANVNSSTPVQFTYQVEGLPAP